jgi:hypothetical protein
MVCCNRSLISTGLLLSLIGLAWPIRAQISSAGTTTGASSASASRSITSTVTTTATASSTAKKTPTAVINPNIVYRWTDAQGRVQYGQNVPEDRKHTARALDGSKINIVKSERPTTSAGSAASPAPAAAQGDSASSDVPASTRSTAGLSAREQCEAAWRDYEASLACFAENRQTIRTQSGVRSVPSPEASKNCKDVPKPSAAC